MVVVDPAERSGAPVSNIRRDALFRLLRRWPLIVVSAAIFTMLILCAVFAPWIATHDPGALNPANRLHNPSLENWFGTDMLGRDIFSRSIYGARVSLIVGLCVAALASLFGIVIGTISGFVPKLDAVIMRFMDGMMSIPSILLAIALVALTRGSLQNVVIAITIAEIPRTTRLIRSVALSIREEPYVEAAIVAGSSVHMTIIRHVIPNTIAPLTVQATYICAAAMIAESILSFIGAGLPPTVPSWGNMISEGRALWQFKPQLIFFPAVLLSLCVLAVNMLGDGLREVLDPRMRRGA